MAFAFDSIKFILFLFFGVFVPGYVLVKRLRLESTPLKLFLSTSLGLVILTLAGFVSLYLVYGVLAIALFFFFRELKSSEFILNRIPKLNSKKAVVVALILLGIVFQNGLTFKSGRAYDFGIGYWGPLGHDGVWHQALVGQIFKSTPPSNPGMSGTTLTNYHYFYDLLVATTSKLTGIASPELIFRFYPILFSFLLGVGTYLFSSILFKKWYVGVASLFFVYFGGSFGYIVEWTRQRTLGGESAFWANQPVSMNLNPPFAISLVLTIASVLIFYVFSRRKNFASGVILVLLTGALIEFKVYAGLIVLFSLGAVALIKLARRETAYLKVFIPSLVLSLLVYLPNNSGSQNLVVFAPFWLVDSMIDFTDRVGWLKLSQAQATYLSGGVWPKYILAEALSLGIFVIGNLGTRIVLVFGKPALIKRKIWKDETFLFIIFLTASSFLPALLFVQKGNPWNTIQFVYYFLYLSAIFAGYGLTVLFKLLPRYISIIVVLVVILATSVSSISTFRSAFQGAPSRLTNEELSALSFLKSQPAGIVLTHPFVKEFRKQYTSPFPLVVYETSAYVSAYSEKETYVEDEFQQEIFQNNYKDRITESNKFFYGTDYSWDKKFLFEKGISYIYLPKLYGISVNGGLVGAEQIFSNTETEIYKVIR